MTKYAQIVSGAVHGVYEYDPLPEFAPIIVMIELPDGSPVQGGWLYSDGAFTAPEPIKPDWPTAIAARRYQSEIAGVTVGGIKIETDDRAKILIDGAALAAVIDPEYSLRWKTADGFVTLTGAQVIGIARAGRDYVQACFDREADLLDMAEAGTITEADLEQGWP